MARSTRRILRARPADALNKALPVYGSDLVQDDGRSHSGLPRGTELEGLLAGDRTRVIRGRMPAALVARAKKRAGIESDTELIEAALASLAVADDYADWLLSQRGTIDPAVNLGY